MREFAQVQMQSPGRAAREEFCQEGRSERAGQPERYLVFCYVTAMLQAVGSPGSTSLYRGEDGIMAPADYSGFPDSALRRKLACT